MGGRLREPCGFTLLELMTTLAVGLLLTVGLLALMRVQAATVRRQSQAADLQQSLRIGAHEIARWARLAGGGGLGGAAIEVRDNVATGYRVGGPGGVSVVPETDVLILRGAFGDPLYELASNRVDGPSSGRVHVRQLTSGGHSQSLQALSERADAELGGALLLAGPAGSVGCSAAELTGYEVVSESSRGVAEEVALGYRTAGSELAEGYATLCDPLLPIERATRVGLLEEYRFYVRRDPDPATEIARHRLTRARFRPGTDILRPGSPAGGEDLVDHALDLQVALGIDLDFDGAVRELFEGPSGPDEWLGNQPDDRAEDRSWQGLEPTLIRLTLLLRSARSEPGYLSPALEWIENRFYGESIVPRVDATPRRFQRGRFETTVRRRR